MTKHESRDAAGSLEERIAKDVEKTGFPTEILATGLLQTAGWTTLDHAYYIDKDENKGREIDIFAIREFREESNNKEVALSLGLSVEVKKSSDKPWVIVCSKAATGEKLHDAIDTKLARMHGQEIWFHELYASHPVTQFARVGRVPYQAFLKNSDQAEDEESKRTKGRYSPQPFSAFVSCFKASMEISNHFQAQNNQALRTENGKKSYFVGVTHGLVILNGKLFEARVGREGKVTATEKRHIPYIFNYASEKYLYRKLLIDVVTIDALEDYISSYERWAKTAAKFCLTALS